MNEVCLHGFRVNPPTDSMCYSSSLLVKPYVSIVHIPCLPCLASCCWTFVTFVLRTCLGISYAVMFFPYATPYLYITMIDFSLIMPLCFLLNGTMFFLTIYLSIPMICFLTLSYIKCTLFHLYHVCNVSLRQSGHYKLDYPISFPDSVPVQLWAPPWVFQPTLSLCCTEGSAYSSVGQVDAFLHQTSLMNPNSNTSHTLSHTYFCITNDTTEAQSHTTEALTAFKRVDQKVRPVAGTMPEETKVMRQFPEDPLMSLIPLTPDIPKFIPTAKLTQERIDKLNINKDGFMWPEEEKLFLHILRLNERCIAFEDRDRGTLRSDYFSPYIMPVIPHEPWKLANIPIPPGIKEKVIQILREKIAAGVYEPSQASYRSRWFCVLKKNGDLRLVHDLQPLNKVSIRDAGVPPIIDNFVEPFAGYQCYTVFDLFSGYDARTVDPQSRDLTSFMTPLGLLRITCIPQGYTNSPAEFQNCMTFILQDEIPHVANIFIDDLPIKGPQNQYLDENGNPETLSANPGIRRFIWEHALDVHRILHRLMHAGATISAKKMQICKPEVIIVAQKCSAEGRRPEDIKVDKVLNWPPLRTVKDVRGFLGLCGTVRIWIRGYSGICRPLTELIRKDIEFIWDNRREQAFQHLKHLISSAPALHPIDYASDRPVYMSVDSSTIAVGFILSQDDESGRRRPARYGSLPFNERESRYSQPKLELYGCFRALRHWRLYLIGVKKLILEVDAKYIKDMLNNPDLQPNATINRWIQGVLLFDFELRHVPADKHRGPDALSRRQPTIEEQDESEQLNQWLEDTSLFLIHNTHIDNIATTSTLSFLISENKQEQLLYNIQIFLQTLQTPTFSSVQSKRRFLQHAAHFFLIGNKLYKRRTKGPPLLVIFDPTHQSAILTKAHEQLGHRGVYGVFHHIRDRFHWPNQFQDAKHHVSTCHQCQIWNTKRIEVPPTIRTPVTLFSQIYVDVMFMPNIRGYRYIVAARDDLTHAAEGRALKKIDSKSISKFLWEEIICRYGHIAEIVTDNGAEFHGATERLLQRYGIPQIKISPYNKHATGVVEQGHFTIREAILKDCNGDLRQWPDKVHLAFFADRVTTRRSTGFSPFYLLHGAHPILPFDLTEATFMISAYRSGLTSIELLALRMRQLDKRPQDLLRASQAIKRSRIGSKEQFERRFRHRISQVPIQPGMLILVRNSARDAGLIDKYTPRYAGPYIVHHQTKYGAYVLTELDGTFLRQGYAAFRLIPYRPRLPRDLATDPVPDSVEDQDPGSNSQSTTSRSSVGTDEWVSD